MKKAFSIIVSVSILLGAFDANAFRVVDAETKVPLPLASITDRSDNVVGMTDKSGVIPELQKARYPIAFNYMGYASLQILKPADYMELYLTDREFLSEEEGKSLRKEIPSIESSDIWALTNANALHPTIIRTVERVNSL